MTIPPATDRLVLEEFRLSDDAAYADADRALAAGDPAGVPLLTSIADDRDVASVRCVPGGAGAADEIDHAAFGTLVARWGALHAYWPRIAESSLTRPASYRLAVTESGINDRDQGRGRTAGRPVAEPGAQTAPLELLWIGAPRSSHAGLLVLIGDGQGASRADTTWPLALGAALGVRIYRAPARA